jgi:flavin reductase (DIM6/NTAB) family NADH-FMN oxidoreductase RutF
MKDLGNIRNLKENPVKIISDDWALLSSGKSDKWNTMTVSWGGIGELWGRDVVFVFVRPQRYTKEFIDSNDYFTLSFFDEKYKDALRICGSKSGRDCNKTALAGLTAVQDGEAVYPEQARLVIVCKKIAVQKMDNAGFIDKSIEENYSKKDYHYTYVGEIIKVLEK